MSEDAPDTGPSRPKELNFLRAKSPGKPVVLKWDRPGAKVAGYKVFSTDNRFPAQMAGALFAGQMKQFIDEQQLDRGATEFRVARADAYYGMIWFDIDDNYYAVDGLCEPAEAQEVLLDVRSFEGTQVRTFLRCKFVPGIVPMRDHEVLLWVRDIQPNTAALNMMASGEMRPDFVLKAEGDGFVDTLTEQEWRKHYVVIAVGTDGVRRPLGLEMGGYLRVEEPQLLERGGKRKLDALMDAVRQQLELELQRRSVDAAAFKKMLKRADDLAPFSPMVRRLTRKAQDHYGRQW